MIHKIKLKISSKNLKKLKNYIESDFFLKSKIHKTVNNDLKRKIRFFQDYVEIDNFSGQTLDSNFLANFNYNTDFNTILKNWYNPYLFLRKLIGYFLFRRWEIRRYINFFVKLWPKSNDFYVPISRIKKSFKLLHYERLLAYNYFNEFVNYIYNEFNPNKTNDLNIIEIGPGVGNLCIAYKEELKIKDINFCLLDFSEAIVFSALNIMYHLPNKNLVMPNEITENSFYESKDSIFFITPEQLYLIPQNYFDLAINTNSFHEMSPPIIKSYFQLLRKVLKDKNLFLTVNRFEKAMDLKSGQSVGLKFASEEIYLKKNKNMVINRFEEYPWNESDKIYAKHTSEFNKIKTKNNFMLKIVKLDNEI